MYRGNIIFGSERQGQGERAQLLYEYVRQKQKRKMQIKKDNQYTDCPFFGDRSIETENATKVFSTGYSCVERICSEAKEGSTCISKWRSKEGCQVPDTTYSVS